MIAITRETRVQYLEKMEAIFFIPYVNAQSRWVSVWLALASS